jgi:Ca2+-binding EF-hand superfamily protein
MGSEPAPRALSDEKRAELREDFEYLDDDQDGLMQFDEFVKFMDGLGAEMTSEECRIGFREIDSNRDGRIEFGEFLSWWTTP